MVIIDTSVIIDHLRRGGISLLVKIEKQHPGETLAISAVTVQELYEGKSVEDDLKEKSMLAVLAGLKILPYTYSVAKEAGTINRKLKNPVDEL